MRRKVLAEVAKVAFSLTLITWLLYRVDLSELLNSLRRANLSLFALAFAVYSLGVGLNTYRWWALLAVQGITVPFYHLLELQYIGFFFSMFLPGRTGGDVVRAYELAKGSEKKYMAVSSVLVWRLIGFSAMFGVATLAAVIAFFVGVEALDASSVVLLAGSSLTVGLTLFVLLLRIDQVREVGFLWQPLLKLVEWVRLDDPFQQAVSGFLAYTARRMALVSNLLLGMVVQIILILAWYIIALALGLNIAPIYVLLFVPLTGVIQVLPISLGGLGVREGAMVWLLGQVRVAEVVALTWSLLYYSLGVINALIGGIVYLLR